MIHLSLQLSCHILPHCDISRVTHLLYALASYFPLALCWPEVASYPFGKAHVMFLPNIHSRLHEHMQPQFTSRSCTFIRPRKRIHLACINPAARSPTSATSRFSMCIHHAHPSIATHTHTPSQLRFPKLSLTQTSFSFLVPIPPRKMLRTLPRHLYLPRRQ